MAKCQICESPHLKAIDDDIRNEITGVEISKKYGVHQMAISRHKRHMARDNLEDIREILNEGIDRNAIKISNPGDYIRLLEYEERQKIARCETCEYKLRASSRTIEQAISQYLNPEGGDDSICVTVQQYAAFQRWVESLPKDDPAYIQYIE